MLHISMPERMKRDLTDGASLVGYPVCEGRRTKSELREFEL